MKMASVEEKVEAVPSTDDDEAWLYGDDSKSGEKANGENGLEANVNGRRTGSGEKREDREEGEMSGEEESQEKDDDDDDDSDDDVQVTIGNIQTFPINEPRNLFKPSGGYQKPNATAASKSQTNMASSQKGSIDLDTPGTINGVNQFDFDLDTLEEKPWRKPGADITDYFNYGFNEETWVLYCERQKRLRAENPTVANRVFQTSISSIKKDGQISGIETPQTVQVIGARNKTTPVLQRRPSGTINVIGTTARDSRRQDVGDPIPVAGAHKPFTSVPPGLTSHPPPGMPPMPDFAVPPPGLPPPTIPPPVNLPPGMPPTIPPPGFPPEFDPFYPPPGQTPISHYEDRSFSSFNSSYSNQHNWQGSRSEDFRWNEYPRERSPGARSDHSDLSSSGSDKDSRYRDSRTSRYSDRRYSRDNSRESFRSRDRDSVRERERSRSRDRDRSSREYRHRDDKHRSRRKHRDDEDSDHHRSKHKKSKKSKKEKDELEPGTPSQENKPE